MEELTKETIDRIIDTTERADRIIKELEDFLNDGNTDKDDKEA